MEKEDIWPYVMVLPGSKRELKSIFNSLFKSEIPLEIISSFDGESKLYQSFIIQKFKAHSNKSVLNHLNRLVDTRILESGMERVKLGSRSFWVRWYKLSKMGRYMLSLFNSKIESDKIRHIIKDLFSLYITKVIKIAEKYNIEMDELKELFDKAFMRPPED